MIDERRRTVRDGYDLQAPRFLLDDVVTMREPEGEATFLWVLAQR